MSTAPPSVVRSFDVISRVYDNPLVQRVVYRANHDAVISALRTHGARRVAYVGCGTGILASRVERELNPEVVYGCDRRAECSRRPAPGPERCAGSRARPRIRRSTTVISTRLSRPRRSNSLTSPRRSGNSVAFSNPGYVVIAVITPAVPLPRALLERKPVAWHTATGMRRLLEDADFEVVDQRRLRVIAPDVATMAVKTA